MDRKTRVWGGYTSRRLLGLLLVLPMLLAAPAARPQQHLAAPRAQPLLLQLARSEPHTPVSVIVQRTGDAELEPEVAALGGTVTMQLRLINAFAAELPAGQVPALARHEGVRWISYDAPVVGTSCSECIDTTNLANAYIGTIRAAEVWNTSPYLQGQGVTVAIVDSGITQHADLRTGTTNRVITETTFVTSTSSLADEYGHGTHIAGIVGGNGNELSGQYIGVAPKVNLINVKVSDATGAGSARHVVNGLEWIYNNKDTYNIRVVNLSLNASEPESYNTNPIDAAVEVLWFNGIVVVVSAGNTGSSALHPPANDPFVITVGSSDDQGTADPSDDTLASFSAYGTTEDGYSKPDLVAPGRNISATMADASATLPTNYPSHIVSSPERYFRMSGTSVSAPMVAGAAALLLQDEPTLTPDQVKYRLMATARPATYSGAGAGVVDVYAAVNGTTTESANTGTPPSALIDSSGSGWDSTSWDSVTWGSVTWGSVTWGSVTWGSVTWASTYWGD